MGALKFVHDTVSGWLAVWTRSRRSGAWCRRVGRVCVRYRTWPAVAASGLAMARLSLSPPWRSCCCCRQPLPCRDGAAADATTSPSRPHCCSASHCRYRKQYNCRVPEGLPSAFHRALGKHPSYRMYLMKHSANI